MRKFSAILSLLVCAIVVSGCSETTPQSNRKVVLSIDWVPSSHYYGIFYAKEKGYFKSAGFDVELRNGTGAPNVAALVAAGGIDLGTTTSDNVARQIERGLPIAHGSILLGYNPNSLSISPSHDVRKAADLAGLTVGVNPQSAAYQQFQYLLKKDGVSANSFTEYPIGFGGAEELLSGRVDAFLGYSSNQALLARIKNPEVQELLFDTLGIRSAGLVLISGTKSGVPILTKDEFASIAGAVQKGFEEGAKDIEGSVQSLRRVEPSLDESTLRAGIRKIARLRGEASSSTDGLDEWLLTDDVGAASLREMRELLSR